MTQEINRMSGRLERSPEEKHLVHDISGVLKPGARYVEQGNHCERQGTGNYMSEPKCS